MIHLNPLGRAALLLAAVAGASSIAAQEGSAGERGDPRLGSSRWGKNYFPDVELTSHEGERLRFFDDLIEGKVVAINFIYTSCPDACPMETARLAQVQRILGDRVGKDVFFYSISIDPEVDTPEVLAEYAERYDAGPGWLFLTGDEDDIVLLRKSLGLFIDEIQNGTNDHNLSLMIGNQATGQWTKRSPFENPHVLAQQLGDWLHGWRAPREARPGYDEAPELRAMGKGEELFRTRCAACHTVGTGDGLPRVGPDLLGVTERRERAWLERWIAEPDAMLAEGDPLALELFEQYRRVPMPNMRLGPRDVELLLEYLDEESRWVASTAAPTAGGTPPAAPAEGGCCEKDLLAVIDRDEPEAPAAATVATETPAGPPARDRYPLGVVLLGTFAGFALGGLFAFAFLGRRPAADILRGADRPSRTAPAPAHEA